MTLDYRRDSTFDMMRLISIFGVIVMHVTSLYGIGILIDTDHMTSVVRYILLYSFSWSVPIFFMVSGALLLSKNESMHVFYKKRMKTVLIPTLFWTCFYLSMHYVLDDFSLFSLVAATLKANPYYHLWFMFAIIGLYVFTPFFRMIIYNTTNKQRYIFIVVIFMMSIIQNYLSIYLQNTSTVFTVFLPYIGFYFLGYELYKSKINFSSIVSIGVFLFFLIFMLALGYISQTEFGLTGNVFASFLSPLVIGQAIIIFIFISNIKIENYQKLLTKLSSLVLGVYLIHPIAILFYQKFFLDGESQLLNIFLAILFTIIFSFIVTVIIKNRKFITNII